MAKYSHTAVADTTLHKLRSGYNYEMTVPDSQSMFWLHLQLTTTKLPFDKYYIVLRPLNDQRPMFQTVVHEW